MSIYSVFELPHDFTIDNLNKAFQAKQELSKNIIYIQNVETHKPFLT
jgi:hypothetical protein